MSRLLALAVLLGALLIASGADAGIAVTSSFREVVADNGHEVQLHSSSLLGSFVDSVQTLFANPLNPAFTDTATAAQNSVVDPSLPTPFSASGSASGLPQVIGPVMAASMFHVAFDLAAPQQLTGHVGFTVAPVAGGQASFQLMFTNVPVITFTANQQNPNVQVELDTVLPPGSYSLTVQANATTQQLGQNPSAGFGFNTAFAPASVPEPGSAILLGIGAAGVAALTRVRRRP